MKMERMSLSRYEINIDHELEVANFYRSLGIICGEGDIIFRIIILVLSEKGEYSVTHFSDIRKYTDAIADKGSVGSKMKNILLLEGLAIKVERGGYVITEKGLVAAEYIKRSTENYSRYRRVKLIVERIPS
jgi:predicted transcriptional regulator